MQEFDLIVVGAGSGLEVASAAASEGMDVAVVEDGPMGGTCLNRGCIPSKMLIHRADVAHAIDTAGRFGIDASLDGVDFAAITEEVTAEVSEDAASIARGIEQSEHHTLFRGEAAFVDEKVLQVDGEQLTADTIVVAAGSGPMVPPVDGLEDVDYWTSTEALRAEEQPDRLVVIGGGYIAAELAYFYGALGTDITIIEMADRMVGNEDRDVQEAFTAAFQERHDVHLGYKATQVEEADGTVTVTAENKAGETVEAVGDALLVAAGRVPNTDRLDVAAAGIETDDRGFIETDDHLRTSVDGIYALGDIAGNWMFKHSANLEAEYVARNAVHGQDVALDDREMPHAIFSRPQVAGVGRTEQALETDGRDYVSASYPYGKTGMGAALKEDGFVKVLAAPGDGTILGCHILGPHASILIHEVLVAMRHGSGTVHDIQDTVHIHPAINEVVQRACNKIG